MNLMLNGIEAIRDANGQVNVRSQLTEDNQVLGSIIDTGMGPLSGMIDKNCFDLDWFGKSNAIRRTKDGRREDR
jgi:phosphoglycerate-specific signal transduction histidine kinase